MAQLLEFLGSPVADLLVAGPGRPRGRFFSILMILLIAGLLFWIVASVYSDLA